MACVHGQPRPNVRLGLGVAVSMALGQFLSKLLFGVTPFDVPTLRRAGRARGGDIDCVVVARLAGHAVGSGRWVTSHDTRIARKRRGSHDGTRVLQVLDNLE